MFNIARRVAELGVKHVQKVRELDVVSPLSNDTAAFVLEIAKEIIKPW